MNEETAFLCDAMLGGLARWLRAAGYQAAFDVHARDGALVRRALEGGSTLLTSDSGIMARHAVAQGLVQCMFVPRGLSKRRQLAHVLRETGLPLKTPRCMLCGGLPVSVPLSGVAGEVPRKVQAACTRFFRCDGCGKVYWQGRHWDGIEAALREAAEAAGCKTVGGT